MGSVSQGKFEEAIHCLRKFVMQMHNKMLELENEGQNYDGQHSQWCHSMENIKLCKSHDAFLR